ncbi:T9SS type A sorting domain-containing protein [Hymenobacter rubidus]|uniref:T9SS type A sorting domain-containing protein n=1 Tax=Hymenobacter rubidus TaxID=1441626 RepID=UPI00191F372E|nr:T9SS type A sorting domain-containing protein [Hymenobacter rubidus]
MRQTLRFLTYVLLSGVLALAGISRAQATHLLGGQITYRYVSGDTYEVTVSLYRDCTGISLPASAIFITAQQGCNGIPVGGMLTAVPGSATIGTAYCPAIQALATCTNSQTAYPNYEKMDYRGTIVLPPAATWIISYDDCCRPSTGNIPTQDAYHFEATLNNLVTVNGVPTRMNNSSPTFAARDVLVPFVTVNQQSTIRLTAAAEADGDSLVYSLDAPLSSCGVYNPYSPRPTAVSCAVSPLPAAPGTSCFTGCTLFSGPNYSAELPLPVAVDTVGFCGTVAGTVYVRNVRPRFQLDNTNGRITFTPSLYRAGNPALGLNKYVVVGKVTEYRRLPGSNRRYRVGSVRRDFMVIVFDGPGNTTPNQPVVVLPFPPGCTAINSPDTIRISVPACSYNRIRLSFTDADNITTPTHPAVSPLQNLLLTYTGPGTIQANQLQNGDIGTYQLLGNGTSNPEMRFYLQPGSTYVGRTIYIPLHIEDDGCPLKGVRDHVIVINIRYGPFAVIQVGSLATSASQTTICAGESLTLTGQVLRPDSVRQQASGTTVAQVYAYQWRTLAGGNLPLLIGNSTITVSPTQTTRYYLTATPTLGFAQGTCNDTSSVLVRVVPRPAAPTVARVGTSLVSSAATGNQWYRNSTIITGATSQTLVPTSAGNYAVTTSIGPGPTQCTSAMSSPTLVATAARAALAGTSVFVSPNPTPDGRVNVQLTGYRQATTLALFDVLGRPVFTTTIAAPDAQGTTYPLNLSQLPTGVYVLRVRTAGGVDVCRIVRE